MTPTQAAEKYKWCKYDKDTNTIELFLDHFMLSSSRQCEAAFYLNHLAHIKPNYNPTQQISKPPVPGMASSKVNVLYEELKEIVHTKSRKPWFLDFGEYLHYMFEIFYKSFIHKEQFKKFDMYLSPDQQCLNLHEFLELGKKVWLLMDMECYKDKSGSDGERYSEVGGWLGVSMLLTQYYVYYMDLRVRVVDTEIVFGYDREVPIGEFYLNNTRDEGCGPTVKCYLTGRIDLLVDNGNKIGPVDHKHTHKFRGNEQEHFNPQDAITGYILATREILKRNYPKYFATGRECLSAWVYHISACTPSVSRTTKQMGPRFKTTPIDKSHSQLEDFKQRQLSSFKRIAELLFNNKVPEWNTNVCDFFFARECPYKEIHRQPSEQWAKTIQDHYIVGEQWNPRERGSNEIDIKLEALEVKK